MQRLVVVTLKLILILKLSLSLVCDGDFQAHTLVPDIYGDAYRYLTSNSSCWFNLYGGIVEIKLKVNPRTTNMVQLVHNAPYTLCQDIVLQIGKKYELGFNVYHQQQVLSSAIYVKINYNIIFNHTTFGRYNFSKASADFTPNTTINRLCFESVFTLNPFVTYVGPCLDNITLAQMAPVNATNLTNFTNSIN